ncbi:hypothetical protein B0T10DRAFT_585128 [Thelonectria olida]|uniref:Uncharacterized protein n=1 Tax=Thelonectria olida TaxID=1576542 RepID=A0A9P9AK38_9HYPO|nr:hypothetical protein B0T10DRAFT_585128 [Thelonectria olida]
MAGFQHFKVYVTADLDHDAVINALCDDDEEDAGNFKLETLRGQKTQDLIQRHRNRAQEQPYAHPTLFLVFDTEDLDERGVLLVSLDEYHGFDDAVRYPPEDANSYISSLSIENEDWYTLRQDVPDEKNKASPVNWFALYNLLPSSQHDKFTDAALAMNSGTQYLGIDEPEEHLDVDELPKLYRAIRPDRSDIGVICDRHASLAENSALCMGQFAAIDDDYKIGGALIVQVKPQRDSFRCKGEVAGELLRWIFINLMDWDEAKEFARRR